MRTLTICFAGVLMASAAWAQVHQPHKPHSPRMQPLGCCALGPATCDEIAASDCAQQAGQFNAGATCDFATGDCGQAQPNGGTPSQALKTGQTTAHGTASDGDLRTGAARSFTDNRDGTITGTTTGLMWEKKDRTRASIHNWNNVYTWGIVHAPYTMNGTMVTTFLAVLNNRCANGTTDCTTGGDRACVRIGNGKCGFAGYRDWRIPNQNELLTLVNYQNSFPAVDRVFKSAGCVEGCTVLDCSCTAVGFYWSSTTFDTISRDLPNRVTAWGVDFGDGHAQNPQKNTGYFVRAVRGGL